MSPKSLALSWIGYILFSGLVFFSSSIGVAKQREKTSEEIFFITSRAESIKGGGKKDVRGEKRRKEENFGTININMGSYNFIKSTRNFTGQEGEKLKILSGGRGRDKVERRSRNVVLRNNLLGAF